MSSDRKLPLRKPLNQPWPPIQAHGPAQASVLGLPTTTKDVWINPNPKHPDDHFSMFEREGWVKYQPASEDADRYRFLREQGWWKSKLCVVMNPKQAVKLGEYCPHGSILDLEVDRARGLIK